jgi:hypothetical protein
MRAAAAKNARSGRFFIVREPYSSTVWVCTESPVGSISARRTAGAVPASRRPYWLVKLKRTISPTVTAVTIIGSRIGVSSSTGGVGPMSA